MAFSRSLQRAWYSSQPIWFFIPLAWLFWLLSSLRRFAYELGILRTAKLPVPVVVAGNITVGGTGKTPFIVWLAQELQRQGLKPGIVTRGYGGSATGSRLATPDSDPAVVGDEALLLARRSAVPVAVGRDRAAAAELLIARYPLDVILSDDGLQHYRLPRCHEIVLLDGERGLGNGWLLPAGPLRETEARLGQAQQLVIKQVPGGTFVCPAALHMALRTDTAVSLLSGERRPVSAFAGQEVHALAGIGNPQQFFATLQQAGLKVIESRPLPDHARPTAADLTFNDPRPVFMTEKDAVKCARLALGRHWYLEAAADFDAADAQRIVEGVERALQKKR